MKNITYFGKTTGRMKFDFGMYDEDRFRHLYIVGMTGTGKTTFLKSTFTQDAKRGHGLILIDPHGDLAFSLSEELKEFEPVVIDVADSTCVYGYNPLQNIHPEYIPLAVSGILESLRSFFHDSWGSRMEAILRATLYALLEIGESDFSDIIRFLNDRNYRAKIVKNLKNHEIRNYWINIYEKATNHSKRDLIQPIETKILALLSDHRVCKLFTRKDNLLRFRLLMDKQRIVIINLSKGRLGSDSASLLGSLMLTNITLAALSRASQAEEDRKCTFVYLDESHLLTTETLAEIVSELRKYRVGLIFSSQSIFQFPEKIRNTVLGNIGSLIVMKTGFEDATYFSRLFDDRVKPSDIQNLAIGEAYARLLVEGKSGNVFSMKIDGNCKS